MPKKGLSLQLTAECRDLLDRIFQTDEKRRITMADIKGHAWYRKPLLPEYQAAADKIEALQAEHDEYTSHRKISSVRHCIHISHQNICFMFQRDVVNAISKGWHWHHHSLKVGRDASLSLQVERGGGRGRADDRLDNSNAATQQQCQRVSFFLRRRNEQLQTADQIAQFGKSWNSRTFPCSPC